MSRLSAKRVMDVAGAALLLGLLSAPMLLVAGLIWLQGDGPVLFRQLRGGLDGRPFMIVKFRTLPPTDVVLLDRDGKEKQTGLHDPRLTRLGRVLRRSGIDELPQLLNVLRGEMSLVGPRPHVLSHDRYYGQRITDYAQRYTVLPGLTGWAQVHGLTQETATLAKMQRRVACDLWYVAHRNTWLDVQIALLTPWAMLRPLRLTAATRPTTALKKQAVI